MSRRPRIERSIGAIPRPIAGSHEAAMPATAVRRTLFVTGMQRSGTTLLQKLLDARPDLSVLSQPFPLMFVEAKRAFLQERGFTDRLPLGALFLERRYRPEEFVRFLDDWRPAKAALIDMFERMAPYSGQYARFDAAQISTAVAAVDENGDFAKTMATLYRALGDRPAALLSGGKETTCEEYLPYLIERGCRCLLIIRDPRDVIASLNYGRGTEYGGEIKPTLLNVRNWRRSVAFALLLEGRAGFHWLRYEDLVSASSSSLPAVSQALSVPPSGSATAEISDRGGFAWTGNSSHYEYRGIGSTSVGAYRQFLPDPVTRFVEATCLPEMRLLGYETGIAAGEAPDIIRDFAEPYPIRRAGVETHAASAANLAEEVRRLQLLDDDGGADASPYFLFGRALERLREAWAS